MPFDIHRLGIPTAAVLALFAGCHSLDEDTNDPVVPSLYADLSQFSRTVNTQSERAQRYFNQGLVLAWAFNHDEAQRAFEFAAELDPDCAMAWWGVALVNGPHINNPTMDAEHSQKAWEAISTAKSKKENATPIERELIDALAKRYSAKPPEDRHSLDEDYAKAMREVWHAHPNDSDVGALCAEALMDLQPWDLWTLDGKPKGNTTEIVNVLETVLARSPRHPGANHLYIHTMEASPHPELAVASAEILRDLVPGAGHLVHMPSHIDARLGHYAKAIEANERAIAADKKHAKRFPHAGFYRIYMLHNQHFLAWASMMEGNGSKARAAAHAMVAGVPKEFLTAMAPLIDGYYPVELHVALRFGEWKQVLDHAPFPEQLIVSNCVLHYARGIALAALDRVDEAEGEAKELASLIAKLDDRPIGNNPAKVVLGIPTHMLAGEIAYRRGREEEAFRELGEAVRIQDTLTYDEPPDWMMPARHSLGAALLQSKRFVDAEEVFRADLARNPENGWSLFGLHHALEQLGRMDEARDLEARFKDAWAHADVKLHSPCFCQPGW